MDLVEIVKRPEGKTLEFKRDLSSPDGALKAIVAFANTAGGTLLIGVEDKSGHIRGIAEPLDLEERLANLISDHIVPRLVPEIEVLPWRRTQVVAVQVHPSPTRPHYLKREGIDAGVYVRVGSTNRRADRELREELGRFARGEAFDEQPMPDLDSEAIDFRAASESFSGVRKLGRRDLENLRLITEYQGKKVPTFGGFLLFGRQRDRTSLTHGCRQDASLEQTRAASSIPRRSDRTQLTPLMKASPLSKSTCSTAPLSVQCVATSTGVCRP